ncbi:MAG: hypothetical protein LBH17_05775 [Oscillospiraceae bacterium]|jgi:Tfp pilus assembly protein PilE|nr:hypothetical protein [Oscillospiraceae bacterium]
MSGARGAKTSLFLVELIIALLLFAFCAAVCIQIFRGASTRVNNSEALSRAVFEATAAAELYKAHGGDMRKTADEYDDAVINEADDSLTIHFDEAWEPAPATTPATADFTLTLRETQDGAAEIIIRKSGAKDAIFTIKEVRVVS